MTAIDTPPQTDRRKRKKKKEEEEQMSSNLPEVPAPIDIDTPPKKKKKKKKKEEEQRSSDLPEVPAPVNIDTPPKKKKKTAVSHPPPIPQCIAPVQPDPPGGNQKKKKKKKKKSSEGGLAELSHTPQLPEFPAPADPEKMKKRKKKIKKRKEENERDGSPTNLKERKRSREEKERKKGGGGGKKDDKAADESRKRNRQSFVMVTPGGGKEDKMKKRKTGEKVRKRKRGLLYGETEDEHTEEQDQRFRELQEFIPNLNSRAPSEVDNLLRYDLARFKQFREQGVELRSGRHTVKENERIRENVYDFLALTGISTAHQLFYPQKYEELANDIRKLRKQHRFLERIAEGVARPCKQVYIRARKMFDADNSRGRFSKAELKVLEKLHTHHGNDWKTISQKMERSIFSLEKRFNHIAEGRGPWAPDEVERLMKALHSHIGSKASAGPWIDREQLIRQLPWKNISQQVQSRSWTQCREKWFTLLVPKMAIGRRSVFGGGVKTLKAKLDLIKTLYNMRAEDVADVDWEEVALAVGRVSPFIVQKNFHRLKVSRVPHWSSLPYCEVIDSLYEKEVPRLEELLRKAADSEEQEAAGEERYLLSDIFSTDSEEFREVDNT